MDHKDPSGHIRQKAEPEGVKDRKKNENKREKKKQKKMRKEKEKKMREKKEKKKEEKSKIDMEESDNDSGKKRKRSDDDLAELMIVESDSSQHDIDAAMRLYGIDEIPSPSHSNPSMSFS